METKLYEGIDGEKELEIVIPVLDYLDCLNRMNVGGFVPVCDFCGIPQIGNFYFYPELGSKLLCNKCAMEYKERAKWYPEDTSAVFNSLVGFVINYPLKWTLKDYAIMNEYFYYHGHGELKMEKFIDMYGGK